MNRSALHLFLVVFLAMLLAATPTPGSSQADPARTLVPVGTELPALEVITPENASELVELRQVGARWWGPVGFLFSPDGNTLAISSDSGWLLYDSHTLDVATAVQLIDSVSPLAFSPDGTLMATGSRDGSTVRLWDVATGTEHAVLTGHTDWVLCAAFSPDGTLLASGSEDGTIRLWDVSTGIELAALNGQADLVYSVRFSPDGTVLATGSMNYLATGSMDFTVRLWVVATRTELASLPNARNPLFSPDGTLLATDAWNGVDYVDLLDMTTGTRRAMLGNIGAFSPDWTLLATFSEFTVLLYDVATGAERVVRTFTDYVLPPLFSPDGTLMATGSRDGSTVRLWDVATGTEVAVLTGLGLSGDVEVEFSPDGTLLVIGSAGTVRMWGVPK